MLAWLLNPTGRHGLGNALAKRLVEYCTDSSQQVSPIVRRAAYSCWRNGREADVVVSGENFTLVIENKIDADEQEDQIKDLYDNWHDAGSLFLFLTPDGRVPRTAKTPEAKGAFKCNLLAKRSHHDRECDARI